MTQYGDALTENLLKQHDSDELVEMGWEWRSWPCGTDSKLIAENISVLSMQHGGGWELFQTVWNGATVVGIFRRKQFAVRKQS